MTQLADITVKNGASTPVDITFAAQQPQSGSDSALWYYKPAGSTRAQYVRATAAIRRSGSGTAHKALVNITYPFYNELGVKVAQVPVRVEATLPDDLTDAQIKEAIKVAFNFASHTTVTNAIIDASPFI